MKHQINVDYGAERSAALEEAARAKGMTRPDYLQWLAHAAGGEPLAAPPAALTARDIAEHRAAVMERTRVAADWARHGAALRREEREGQLRLARMSAELVADLPERMAGALDPLQSKMDELAAAILAQPRLDAIAAQQEALRAAQEAHTAVLREHAEAVARATAAPRTQYALVLGDDRVCSTLFVTAWSGLMLVLGGLLALLALR